MKYYKSVFPLCTKALLFFVFLFLYSCESSTNKNNSAAQSPIQSGTTTNTSSVNEPNFSSDNLEVKTFEVKDSTGNSQGWGYDIYAGGKKIIHQPIIPAIPGNRSFKSADDAMKTGLLAANKMKHGASLPTLLIKELDSLGVTK